MPKSTANTTAPALTMKCSKNKTKELSASLAVPALKSPKLSALATLIAPKNSSNGILEYLKTVSI